ncbi:hypothetical protein JCM5353_008186 [Sporobolomyces roseus]
MATFLTLPVELQLAIISHLPLNSYSIRANSSLRPLSRTSHHFHSLLTPLIDSKIQLSTQEQAHSYLRGASEETKGFLTSLVLKERRKKQQRWTIETVKRLLANVGSSIVGDSSSRNRNRLTELRIEGGILRLNQDLLKLLKETLQDLVVLDLDLSNDDDDDDQSARAHYPQASNRADYPSIGDAAQTNDRGFESLHSFSTRSSPSSRSLSTAATAAGTGTTTAELELIATCCFELVQLESLKLSNANLSRSSDSSTPSIAYTYPWSNSTSTSSPSETSSSNLRSLELVNCKVSDQSLLRLGRTHKKLRKFSLKECTGYTSAGLGQAIKAFGGSLESLEIALPSPSPSQRSPSSSSSSPYTSPPRSPLRQSPLHFVIDALLPSLSNLTSLSLSKGSLLSPSAISSLPASLPRLRYLRLDSVPTLSPRHLLPLLSQPTKLRSIHFTPSPPSFPPSIDPSCSPPSPHLQTRTITHQEEDEDKVLTELTSLAITREVELSGEVFERVQGRLDWALKESKEQDQGKEVEIKPTTRRKRPGIRM